MSWAHQRDPAWNAFAAETASAGALCCLVASPSSGWPVSGQHRPHSKAIVRPEALSLIAAERAHRPTPVAMDIVDSRQIESLRKEQPATGAGRIATMSEIVCLAGVLGIPVGETIVHLHCVHSCGLRVIRRSR